MPTMDEHAARLADENVKLRAALAECQNIGAAAMDEIERLREIIRKHGLMQ